jgi:hypothetical protein
MAARSSRARNLSEPADMEIGNAPRPARGEGAEPARDGGRTKRHASPTRL